MKQLTILIAATVVASLSFHGAEASYGRLNSYLVGKVNNDDVGANMEAAASWLKEQAGKKQSFLSRTPVGDLKKFTALQQVIGDTECNQAAYEIMLANEQAAGWRKLFKFGHPARRVDKVMLKIFEDHAERCSRVYPEVYRAKMLQLDASQFERAKQFAGIVMKEDKFLSPSEEREAFYQPANLFHRYIEHSLSFDSFAHRVVLYDALTSNARKDPNFRYTLKVPLEPNGKAVVHKDKLMELVKTYLIRPCQNVVDGLGPDLFIPAKFDIPLHLEINNEDGDYYLGWSYYRLCQVLVREEQAVYGNIIKSII